MNWKDRISAAEAAGIFTTEDYESAFDGSRCAIGELFRAEERGLPKQCGFANVVGKELSLVDPLHKMGCRFADAVSANLIGEARRSYDKIQDYAAQHLLGTYAQNGAASEGPAPEPVCNPVFTITDIRERDPEPVRERQHA